jgi:hypothetical protein
MGKFLILLVIVGVCVGGYLTRPTEDTMREAANTVLSNPESISEGMEGLGATMAGDRMYFDYYVATKYSVRLDGRPIVECWGGFTQTSCNRVKAAST